MGFEQLLPFILLGVRLANRHMDQTGAPITIEEATAAAEAEYEANKEEIATEFRSKGINPPE